MPFRKFPFTRRSAKNLGVETSVHSCVALTIDMCASTNRTNDSRNPNPNKEYFYAL